MVVLVDNYGMGDGDRDGWSIMGTMVMVGHSTMAVVLVVLLILVTAMTITITMLEVVMSYTV